jgi:P-type Ca2+ transporter type 2C
MTGRSLSASPALAPLDSKSAQALRRNALPPQIHWSALAVAEIARRLGTEAERGLSPSQATDRLRQNGPNELEEAAPRSRLRQVLSQFSDVTVLALIGAAVLAAVIGVLEPGDRALLERFGDAIAIGIIVILNAAIGFVQERKAERALRSLRQLGAPEATVVRDGTPQRIPAAQLVSGDLVQLSEGARVPADVRLVNLSDLLVSEAALTGESTSVEKDTTEELASETPLAERRNMAFLGTHVVRGSAGGIVVDTGMGTELGRIARMLGRVESPETPLQASLHRFGLLVVAGCLLVGAIVFGVGLWQMQASWTFLLLTGVSLAVAAIPEGLPAITTIVLALGVQRMAKRNALIRRLAAVETLGSADLICTDKTGTLTQNKMSVRRVHAGGTSHEVESLVGAGSLAPALDALVQAASFAPSASRPENGEAPSGDPTDAALLGMHLRLRDAAPSCSQPCPQSLRTLPFDGERKMATEIATSAGKIVSFSHGAPERLLALAERIIAEDGEERPLDAERRAELERVIEQWAGDGLRVLALARSTPVEIEPDDVRTEPRTQLLERFESKLVLVGLVGLADPPRPEAAQSIARARAAGVSTVMITGDHPLTARAIAAEIGLLDQPGEVVLGPELDQLSDDELQQRAGRVRVVARATAESKLRLVEALRSGGHVVAMTGDGVNDAPAIKAASIGVAMGQTGTDVAREAADMVLFDDNYATIVSAIEEGRVIYGNIKRFILFLFSVNAGLVASVFVAAVLGWPPILTPTQILWINLITNGLPAIALGMEPVQSDPMRLPPRDPRAPLVERSELMWLLAYGALMGALGLSTFAYYQASAGGVLDGELLVRARTATFTVLAIGPLFHALNCRSRDQSLLSLGVLSNWRLLGAFVIALMLQAIAVYVPVVQRVFGTAPLALPELLIALAVSASVWLVGEGEKAARRAMRAQPVVG